MQTAGVGHVLNWDVNRECFINADPRLKKTKKWDEIEFKVD